VKKLPIYQVDAFTDRLFAGNPAAVVLLDHWPENETMQAIAAENNLAETAFILPREKDFIIRWFTPVTEVDLCGHATLAAAFILFENNYIGGEKIRFQSVKSGPLGVTKENDFYYLDFPTDHLTEVSGAQVANVENATGTKILELYKGRTDYLARVKDEETVRSLIPDLTLVSKLEARGLIVTAEGEKADFVSRFFAPQEGIDEDDVTGSAHTTLMPFWSKKTGESKFSALQISKRGGQLACEIINNRCHIGGKARLYLEGEISIPE